MKKCILILLFSFFISSIYAQGEEFKRFLFDDFQKGKVIYKKDNQATEGKFNYETIIEKMLFIMPDSTILEFAKPDIISHVIIGNRVFEHINKNLFYEQVNVGNGDLYIRWKSKVIAEKEGPYGSKPATGRIDNISQTPWMGGTYSLKIAGEIKVESQNIYYIKLKNKFKRFDSFDSLAKQFKKNEKDIKSYVKDNNLNFKNIDDIKKALQYCYQLENK